MNPHAFGTRSTYNICTHHRENSMQCPSNRLLLVWPIVISVGILYDDGMTNQIVAGSVKSKEEQGETNRKYERQHEILHHWAAQCQRQAQIGPGAHQDHIRFIRTFNGSYISALNHPQTHHVLARSGTSDKTVHAMLKPEGLKHFIEKVIYNFSLCAVINFYKRL